MNDSYIEKIFKGVLIVAIIVTVSMAIFDRKDASGENSEEPVQEESVSTQEPEKEVDFPSKTESKIDLMSYDQVYKECYDTAKNEAMDNRLAQFIYDEMNEGVVEINELGLKEEYTLDLRKAYIFLKVSMEEYLDGNLDESSEYLDLSQEHYVKYKETIE